MSKNGKIIQFDRNKAAGPWQPLIQIPLSEEAVQSGVASAFQNHRFRVFVKQTASSGFMMQGPDGQSHPMPILHLIISGVNGRKPDYSEIQRIKAELVHEEADAVELFPGKGREIDMPQTHIWCLPPGYVMPLGLVRAAPPDPNAELIPGSSIKREDLLFYIVTTQAEGADQVVEVFASEDDAKACYNVAGNEFLPGQYAMYGRVPTEDEGAAWSPSAVERRNTIQARIEAAGAAMAERHRAGKTPTEEEMRAGVERKGIERLEAISEAERIADEDGDDAAKASLAELREELVRRGRIGKSDGEAE